MISETPDNRRYRHPFVTCTNCGPRFTITTGLPYDRPTTTMAGFPMCADCAAEYVDPGDRRFHAQTICCPACGPRLSIVGPDRVTAHGEDALSEARRLLVEGAVVAVKGLGGYHLACDATNETAVLTLRKRKQRGDKPFAVMVADRSVAERFVDLSDADADLLTGRSHPVVLAPRVGDAPLSAGVAPGSADVGVMLAYTPLHHLLLGLRGDSRGPEVLVMTSGNLAGEPIVIDDTDALHRLADLADAWLTHDRPIHVPCDDSVTRAVDGRESPIRRSRGQAPLPLDLPFESPAALGVGADVKNTFCLAEGRLAWMSAHVGDMDDLSTLLAFGAAEQHLEMLTGVSPTVLAADRHPAYRSRRWALDHASGRPVEGVQHHHAHVAATMADNQVPDGVRVLGVAFDGTGYGEDGAVWGGEFLVADYRSFVRATHLALRRPSGRRRRRAQPQPDGALPPAKRRRRLGSEAAVCAGERPGRACAARPAARHRIRLCSHLEHGPPLRRGRVNRRHLPPGRVRRPGGDGARGACAFGRPRGGLPVRRRRVVARRWIPVR